MVSKRVKVISVGRNLKLCFSGLYINTSIFKEAVEELSIVCNVLVIKNVLLLFF